MSSEKIRLLSAGHSLIGRKPKPVKCLENYFRDRKLYSPDYVSPLPIRPYVTPKSAFAEKQSEIKGLSKSTLNWFFCSGKLNRSLSLYTKLVNIHYLPPWHPVGAVRVTRPSVSVCYSGSQAYNGEQVGATHVRKRTFAFAVWRLRTKWICKDLFMEQWRKSGKLDGTYIIVCKAAPTEKYISNFRYFFETFFEKILTAHMDEEYSETECQKVWNYISGEGHRPQFFSRQQWEETMPALNSRTKPRKTILNEPSRPPSASKSLKMP